MHDYLIRITMIRAFASWAAGTVSGLIWITGGPGWTLWLMIACWFTALLACYQALAIEFRTEP